MALPMTYTRIDCHLYRGAEISGNTSYFTALNPNKRPGSLVAAGTSAARESLGGQVACKLALDNFVDGVLGYFDGHEVKRTREDGDISLEVLETAFKRANSSVYEFGHRLAAGGRMAASLLGLVVEKNTVAAGRVGYGSAYLVREGDIYSFFEQGMEREVEGGKISFVGSNSIVAVELASIAVQEGDVIAMFSTFLDAEREKDLKGFLGTCDFEEANPCQDLAQYLFPDVLDLSYAMLAQVGPDTIYLSEVVGS